MILKYICAKFYSNSPCNPLWCLLVKTVSLLISYISSDSDAVSIFLLVRSIQIPNKKYVF